MSTTINTQCNMRYPVERPLADDVGYWKVAYIKPRNEKALARECEQWEIGYYLPLYVKRVRRKDNNKPRKSVLPLFTGYFPFVDRDDAKRKIVESGRVVNFVDVADQELFVHDLNQIWQAVQSGAEIEPVPMLETGQSVRIKEGPLQGLKGIIDQAKSPKYVVLQVEMFNIFVKVDAGETELEVIEEE